MEPVIGFILFTGLAGGCLFLFVSFLFCIFGDEDEAIDCLTCALIVLSITVAVFILFLILSTAVGFLFSII